MLATTTTNIAHRFSVPVQEDEDGDDDGYDEDEVAEVHVQDQTHPEYDDPPLSPTSFNGYSHASVYDDVSARASSSKSIVIESEASADVYPIRINSSPFPVIPLSQSESYGQVRIFSHSLLKKVNGINKLNSTPFSSLTATCRTLSVEQRSLGRPVRDDQRTLSEA
jgi:hypothetical protein